MRTLPSRRISHAIATLLLAIAVAGVVRIAGRSGDTGSPDPVPEARPPRTRDRQPGRIAGTLSPQDFIESLMARKAGVERDQTLRQAVGTWVEEAPEDALAWIRRFDPGEDRDWLMGSALTALASHDANQAASLLDAEMPPGLARNHALVAIAQRWVQLAPEDARAWLESLATSPAREEALSEIGLISAAIFAVAPE